jgi:hypothetical protein
LKVSLPSATTLSSSCPAWPPDPVRSSTEDQRCYTTTRGTIAIVAGLIYTVPAAYLTTEKFHSKEYSVSKPSAEPTKILYLFDFYGWFRDFQSRLLHGG